jgi:hypothetical protein
MNTDVIQLNSYELEVVNGGDVQEVICEAAGGGLGAAVGEKVGAMIGVGGGVAGVIVGGVVGAVVGYYCYSWFC